MKLNKLHYNFLYTKKVYSITVLLASVCLFILLIQSNIFSSLRDFDVNRELYVSDFLFNGLNLIKILIVFYSMLVVIYTFILNKYDVFLVSRYSKKSIIISKLLVVLFINITLSLVLNLFYLVLWFILDTEVSVYIIFDFLSKMSIFTIYYSLFFILLVTILDNLFIIMIPFVGYLVSSLSIDYGLEVSKLSVSSTLLNSVFPDLLVLNSHFEYVYGCVFVITIIGCYLAVIIYLFLNKDLSLYS